MNKNSQPLTPTQLAHKLLEEIDGQSFHCYLYASEGGACSGGWDSSDEELNLNGDEIRYLIKERIDSRGLFTGLGTAEVDIKKTLAGMAREGAFPDGGSCAHVNDVIPEELEELAEYLATVDEDDAASVAEAVDRLSTVESGDYTFLLTVTNGDGDYYFAEDEPEGIHLESKEALGLLYGQSGLDKVFEKLNVEPLDEDFIDGLVGKAGFAESYDSFDYGGECETVEPYIEAWVSLINMILNKHVTEQDVEAYLAYFDDSENWEYGLSEWYDENHGEEGGEGE